MTGINANALLVLSLLCAGTARGAEVERREPVQPGGIPAPATWPGTEYSGHTQLKPDSWHGFLACTDSRSLWSLRLDSPGANINHDTPHAYLWANGQWVAQTEAADPVNEKCADTHEQSPEVDTLCLANPNAPKLTATLPAGTERFAFTPITGTKCMMGMFRYRFTSPPAYCTPTSAPDYVVPRTAAGTAAAAGLHVTQLACAQVNPDLADVMSKNAVDVAKAGIECIGLGKQALVASWEGNSYDQPGLLLALPRVAGKLPSVNVAEPSASLPPICKLRKTGETEFGLVPGTDSPIRVVRVAEDVDGASAAAVCTRHGYTLADIKTGDTFTAASGIVHQALCKSGTAWIHSYDGDSYTGSCVALTAGDAGDKLGSVTVPAGGCTAKLGAVLCQTVAAASAPMQRRSEL
ncbi:hypothetical protein H9P43_002766 [Blastocladiella emersonii ATCC 22665]|nr:hypothetical protein H9P43_002766 [Blastocladiella emersonii ATCC 22665]